MKLSLQLLWKNLHPRINVLPHHLQGKCHGQTFRPAKQGTTLKMVIFVTIFKMLLSSSNPFLSYKQKSFISLLGFRQMNLFILELK